jgi:hypothetical protein
VRVNVKPEHRSGLLLAALGLVVFVETVSIVVGALIDRFLAYAAGVDKVLHVLAFLGIYLVCERFARPAVPERRVRSMILGTGLLLLATLDELGQGLQPDRDLDARDLLASFCGVSLGVAWAWCAEGARLAWRAVRVAGPSHSDGTTRP